MGPWPLAIVEQLHRPLKFCTHTAEYRYLLQFAETLLHLADVAEHVTHVDQISAAQA